MNTLQNLIDHGINEYTANRMLSEYQQRIGTTNGIYKIIDINYDFDVRGKDVTLECSGCGDVIHRTMINGKNKWSELIKSCPCQKREERIEKQIAFESIAKARREAILTDAKSLIGEEYGDYEIKDFEFRNDIPKFVIKCKTCGHVTTVHYRSVKTNAKYPRECHEHRAQTPIKYDESYIGRKKNFLTVKSIIRRPNNHRAFVCQCDCGNITTIEPAAWEYETVKSCGCFANSLKLEHTEELDRLRRIYNGMIQRCCNPNSESYPIYGGRGIAICDEWLTNREKFIEWSLNNGYSNDLSIDRINVNGNYEPSNCRWATDKIQSQNRRPSSEWRKRKKKKPKTWTIGRETKTINEWCEQYDTSTVAISYRMKKMGMSLEEALKTPKMTIGRPRKEQII